MLKLHRIEQDDHSTRGRFFLNGLALCRSLERPWLDNERNVSCIPAGRYKLRLRVSRRFGVALEAQGVPSRSAILIHPANQVHEIQGCIAPGMRPHVFASGLGVAESRNAFKAICKALAEYSGSVFGPWEFEIVEEWR